MTSDPNSWIQGALDELKFTLASKNEDYKIEGEFSNFEFAAEIAGIEPLDAITSQLAIKLGRIKGLWASENGPQNESLVDSYKDLAGYAVILYAYVLSTYDGADTYEEEAPEW